MLMPPPLFLPLLLPLVLPLLLIGPCCCRLLTACPPCPHPPRPVTLARLLHLQWRLPQAFTTPCFPFCTRLVSAPSPPPLRPPGRSLAPLSRGRQRGVNPPLRAISLRSPSCLHPSTAIPCFRAPYCRLEPRPPWTAVLALLRCASRLVGLSLIALLLPLLLLLFLLFT